jgi:hypothetical protein
MEHIPWKAWHGISVGSVSRGHNHFLYIHSFAPVYACADDSSKN